VAERAAESDVCLALGFVFVVEEKDETPRGSNIRENVIFIVVSQLVLVLVQGRMGQT
jgi:hypothetical protein